jgi:CPA2 family monovalent cation:H+ antiporter-2
MLFNPQFVFSHPTMALGALGIVLLLKPLSALAIVTLLGGTLRTALTVAVGLAQIGEFSFILAALAQSLGVLPADGMDLLVAMALVSIAVNPLLFRGLEWLEGRLASAPDEQLQRDAPPQPAGARTGAVPVAITGVGAVARQLAHRCADGGLGVRVIGNGLDALEALRGHGIETAFGDPGRQEVLKAAGVGAARIIVVTNPSLPEKIGVCLAARAVNPRIAIIATADSAAERAWLEEFGAAYVYDALDETTDGLLRAIRDSL